MASERWGRTRTGGRVSKKKKKKEILGRPPLLSDLFRFETATGPIAFLSRVCVCVLSWFFFPCRLVVVFVRNITRKSTHSSLSPFMHSRASATALEVVVPERLDDPDKVGKRGKEDEDVKDLMRRADEIEPAGREPLGRSFGVPEFSLQTEISTVGS